MGIKFCPTCETEKPLDDFSINQGRHRTYCKPCDRKRQNARGRAMVIRWHEILGDTCKECGYNECLAALDFHHLDPADKIFNISTKLRALNPDTCSKESYTMVLLEAQKCILLCSNCHRKLHYEENSNGD